MFCAQTVQGGIKGFGELWETTILIALSCHYADIQETLIGIGIYNAFKSFAMGASGLFRQSMLA